MYDVLLLITILIMNSFKVNDNGSDSKNNESILKGKNAIDVLHKNISKENEKKKY